MGERIVRYGVKKRSPGAIYAFGKVYKWSPKYLDFIHWFPTKQGGTLGERYSEKLKEVERRKEEASARAVCQAVKKSGATRAECARAAFQIGKLVEEDRESKYRDLKLEDMLVTDGKRAGKDKDTRKKNLLRAIARANLLTAAMFLRGKYGALKVLPDKPCQEPIGKYAPPVDEREFNKDVIEGKIAFPAGVCSVDFADPKRIRKGAVKRRFFQDGKQRQDNDYHHTDDLGTHLFPHIHLWFDGRRQPAIGYEVYKAKYGKKELFEIMNDLSDMMDDGDRWLERNGITFDDYKKYNTPDLEGAISTVKDVQMLLARGLDFGVEYKSFRGYLSREFGYYLIGVADLDSDDGTGEHITYSYEAESLDEFGESATFGPFPLRDVVNKWTITEFTYLL